PVLANRPAPFPNDTALVDVTLALLLYGRVLDGRRRGRRLRDRPPQEQGEREQPVTEAWQQASPGDPAQPGMELAALGLLQGVLIGERLGALLDTERRDEAQVEERVERGFAVLDEHVRRQLPLGDDLRVGALRVVEPEAACLDVALDVHREELLAPRESHD